LPGGAGSSAGPAWSSGDLHSDQGCQFTSEDFTGMLASHGVAISMDGKGRWLDNLLLAT